MDTDQEKQINQSKKLIRLIKFRLFSIINNGIKLSTLVHFFDRFSTELLIWEYLEVTKVELKINRDLRC